VATRTAPLGGAVTVTTVKFVGAVLGELQLLDVHRKPPSFGSVPRPMLTAWLHSAWVKEVKNVQFVPALLPGGDDLVGAHHIHQGLLQGQRPDG
jgi:hypothetical protein